MNGIPLVDGGAIDIVELRAFPGQGQGRALAAYTTRGAIDDWPEILNQNLPHIPNIHPLFVTKCQNGDFSRKNAKRGALVPSFALFLG